LATLLFVVALIVFLGTSPGGDPALSEIRVVILLSVLGTALFLWFLATLWMALRDVAPAASVSAVYVRATSSRVWMENGATLIGSSKRRVAVPAEPAALLGDDPFLGDCARSLRPGLLSTLVGCAGTCEVG
jgi:hypothetical protein